GVVYKAWHLRLNRPVALKMLLAGPYAAPEERARFLQEAEAVAALCHANIVQGHDGGDLDGPPYFTMGYGESRSLAQKPAGTPQPATQAAALLAAIAEAIQVAHQSGIIHRDLKPANILLAENPKSEIRKRRGAGFGFRISDFVFLPQGHGFRLGQAPGRRRGPHRDRGSSGHTQLHGAGTGTRPERRHPAGNGVISIGGDPVPIH